MFLIHLGGDIIFDENQNSLYTVKFIGDWIHKLGDNTVTGINLLYHDWFFDVNEGI